MIESVKIEERGISLRIQNVYTKEPSLDLVVVATNERQSFAADFFKHVVEGTHRVLISDSWKRIRTNIPVDQSGTSLIVAKRMDQKDSHKKEDAQVQCGTFLAGMLTGEESRSLGDGNFARCLFQVRTGDIVGNVFNSSRPTIDFTDELQVEFQDGMLLIRSEGLTHIAGLTSRMNLPDPVMIEEVTGVVAMALYLGIGIEKICARVESFCNRPMVLDHVGTLYGVRYFDNSEIRDFESCRRIIGYFENKVAVILGGAGFRMNEALEADLIRKDVDLVVLPHTPRSEISILSKLICVRKSRSIREAVQMIGKTLEEGSSVLFFPGLDRAGYETSNWSYEFFHEVLNH